MRRAPGSISSAAALASTALLTVVALAGCGGSGSGATTARPPSAVALSSTAIQGGKIPARYTCDGADIAPPLTWGAVPSTVKELVLLAIGVTAAHAVKSVEWAVAGIKPQLHGLAAGKLPAEAVLEQASSGKRQYSICPPKGQAQLYEFVLYAMPGQITVGPGINGENLLHNLNEGPPVDRSPATGAFYASYTRK